MPSFNNACENGHNMLHEQKQYENQRVKELEDKLEKYEKHECLLGDMEAQCEDYSVKDVQVIIDGHRYKVI